MRWPQIKDDEWIIPAEEVQKGKPHVVPLSDPALAVIRRIKKVKSAKQFVFTTTGDTHVTGYNNAAEAIRDAMLEIAREETGGEVEIERWTFHDLRRTAATVMQHVGVDKGIVEKALNHTSGEWAGVVGVYQVDDSMMIRSTPSTRWAATSS